MASKCVILFADIAGSTKLYESLGDSVAYKCVTESLQRMQKSIERFDGRLIEAIGDESLALFPDTQSAIKASCDMNETFSSPLSSGHLISIRIGFHLGDVELKDGHPYGDTVNVAARMTALAEAGQIICTSSSINSDIIEDEFSIRPFKTTAIKGKAEPVKTSEVLWDYTNATSIFRTFELEDTSPLKYKITLFYNDQSILVLPEKGSFNIGRSLNSDLPVQAPLASRNHMKLDYRWGEVILTDTSTNGSYISVDDGNEERVHRREYRLSGEGVIALGSPRLSDERHAIGFRIEKII